MNPLIPGFYNFLNSYKRTSQWTRLVYSLILPYEIYGGSLNLKRKSTHSH